METIRVKKTTTDSNGAKHERIMSIPKNIWENHIVKGNLREKNVTWEILKVEPLKAKEIKIIDSEKKLSENEISIKRLREILKEKGIEFKSNANKNELYTIYAAL